MTVKSHRVFLHIFIKLTDKLEFTVLFSIFGIYEQIMGPADAEKLLKKLHIPLTYNQVLIIAFVFLALMIISYILRAKLSGRI